ncbi:MAG TPA: class I SAM-dependent methyltransferase [Candidatus Binatia bacterium]|nr:class I SAM-dependent methyltransferase [Candidatus Binatia bacterium]
MPTKKSPRREWPMDSYCSAWKVFRRLSNENEETAKHLIDQSAWPSKDGIVLCDIGCGDGRLVESIVLRCQKAIGEIRLLDPDLEMLNQAETVVTETGFIDRIRTRLGVAENDLAEVIEGADVAIMVHVVYLMQPGALESTLAACPSRVPLYVVLDEPNSIFTELWARTAPAFYERSLNAHRLLEALALSSDYMSRRSTIRSQIGSPLRLKRAELRDAILSIFCYADITGLGLMNLRAWIESVVAEHSNPDGNVVCESACYELVRRP